LRRLATGLWRRLVCFPIPTPVRLWGTYFFGHLPLSNSNGAFLTLRTPPQCAVHVQPRQDVMLLHSLRPEQLATLARQVSAAEEANSQLIFAVAGTARRLSPMGGSASAARLNRLIEAGAFTEAALALVELELPYWKPRRITYDEGEWHCAISRQREVPEWLDQAVEAGHADLSLAIASAYLETVRQIETSGESNRPSVPQTRAGHYEPMCCDNFA
jgi:hypothetical protein